MHTEVGFDVAEAVAELDEEGILTWVRDEIARRRRPHDILSELTRGLERLGDDFAACRKFIPELVMGGEIFRKAMAILKPAIEASGSVVQSLGTLVIGTVKGDLHDLGQNLVSVTFTAAGFRVINLGNDVPTERFIETVRTEKPEILGLSALLTTTMGVQREVIEALEAGSLRDSVKVIVGGAVANDEWAKEIGADAYGSDAVDGVRKAKAMLGLTSAIMQGTS